MATGRARLLARQILEDVLSVGSAVTGGPVLTPEQEGEVLDGIEARVESLLQRLGGQAPDGEVRARFREEHPELFRGDARERHRAAAKPGEGGRGG